MPLNYVIIIDINREFKGVYFMNILIKNLTILTVNKKNEVLYDCDIAIEGSIIKYIGNVPKDFKADKTIDGTGKLLMPGLINSHTHMAMTLLRNYADDLPLWEWLNDKIWPIEDRLNANDIYWGSMLGIVESIKSGVTCFSDMYYFMEDTARAVDESGIRACLSRGMMGQGTEEDIRYKETRALYNNWHKKGDGRITVMVAPHAPYTCSPDYLKTVMKLAEELNTSIHIHLSESKKEVEDSFKEYGKSPIKHVYDLGLFDFHVTAAHCVHLSDEDIDIIADKKVSVINNPGSNLKLANGFAPVDKLLKKGVNVALGTDGASSNNNLNMFEEINLASIVNKGITGDPTAVPAMDAVKMATINGARALQLDNEIGSIEEGKKADVVILDIKKPHLYPMHNIISSLAYSIQASDVETVIINGNIVMENGEIKTVDVEKIYYNVDSCIKRIMI